MVLVNGVVRHDYGKVPHYRIAGRRSVSLLPPRTPIKISRRVSVWPL